MAARPVRIAHAYGNSREGLRRALDADVDMIEVDLWFRGGDLRVHHARRLTPLPIFVDRKTPMHPLPPYAVRVWKGYYAWPDIKTLTLGELLETTNGRKRLLLDVKGNYPSRGGDAFASAIAKEVRAHDAAAWVTVCGQTYPPLNSLRRIAPEIEVRYSLEQPFQWESFLGKMQRDETVRQVCMSHRFIDDEKARIMEENGVDLYVWTVDDPERALHWVNQGVDGIISNNLELLETLPRTTAREHGTGNTEHGTATP